MPEDKPWGPENPHPLSRMKTELVWEGKYDEYGNRRPVSLPDFPLVMQKIETIDEPRDAAKAIALRQGDLFDQEAFTQSSHRDDFRNRLIWGDNKLALATLLQEFRGQVSMIYIDPPFDVGADFTMGIELGDNGTIQKEQSIMEAVAYRDIWGKGTDSYLHLIYERLSLMRDLLSSDGSLYVHVDSRMSALLKVVLDEIYGRECFVNEIIWKRSANTSSIGKIWKRAHDTLLFYRKSSTYTFNFQRKPLSDSSVAIYALHDDRGQYRLVPLLVSGKRGGATGKPWRGIDPNTRGRNGMHWVTTPEKLEAYEAQGLIVWPDKEGGAPNLKYYLDDNPGVVVSDLWDDISLISSSSREALNYATQKPEALLNRIVGASTNEGDLVLDAFCGSGTTLAVAEELGRRWLGIDLGRFAIHTTRKRLIGVQRELHGECKPYRSFDVYNMGRYERQWWQQERLKGADKGHREAVLKFFRAQPLENSPNPLLHASRGGAYIHVDKIDSILTLEELKEVAKATHAAGGRKLVCLAWEFEMDLRLRARSLESELDLDIQLKYIPREIMEPNRNELQFFDAAAIEAEAFRREDGSYDVRLETFLPSLTEVPEKELEALRERALGSPFDFIDFWAVDFNHRDDKPFEHHWQDFRTRKDRSLKTESDAKWKFESKGAKQICIKVIDVFGIDTTTVVEVNV